MNGGDIGAAIAVAALVAVAVLMWWRGELLQRELDRIVMEHRMWGAPGVWVCDCGGQRIDRWARVPDAKGMLHGARRCDPDLMLLHGDDVG